MISRKTEPQLPPHGASLPPEVGSNVDLGIPFALIWDHLEAWQRFSAALPSRRTPGACCTLPDREILLDLLVGGKRIALRMSCILRSLLAALLVVVLSALLAGGSLASGGNPEATHIHAMQHGFGDMPDYLGDDGAEQDQSCDLMLSPCGAMPMHFAAAPGAVRAITALVLLLPEDSRLLGCTPEADTPPPRV